MRKTVVITAQTSWSEPPRMRHYVARYLANYFNVIFCELYQKGPPKITKISDYITVYRVGGYLPGLNRIRAFSILYNRMQASLIMRYVAKAIHDDVILLNFKYDFSEIYRYRGIKLKYLFLNDDFVNMHASDSMRIRESKRRRQNRTIRLCDRVFVSSNPLAEDIKGMRVPCSIIYSGHDFTPCNNEVYISSPEIKVCFMGFINRNLELNWIMELAKRPNIKVAFIGPIECKGVEKLLRNNENIELYNSKEGSILQKFMSKYDVFIMPYTKDPVNTKTTVPAKLFQYLACGRPIVASNLPNLISLPEGFIYRADNEKDFVEKVIRAKEEDNVIMQQKRILYSLQHGWDKRVEVMFEIISTDLNLKTGSLKNPKAGRIL